MKQSLVGAMKEIASPDAASRSGGIMELPLLDDGQTVEELAAEAGKGDEWVRSRLKALAAQGRLIIGRRQVVNLAGQRAWTFVYKNLDAPAVEIKK